MTSELVGINSDLSSIINFIESGSDLGELIDQGVDSTVYKSPDGLKVIKLYVGEEMWRKRSFSHNPLEFYQKITNSAAQLTESEIWCLRTDQGVDFSLKVIPIDVLFRSKLYSKFVSICRFIEGPNMSNIKNLENFDLELYGGVVMKLYSISQDLNEKLGVTGINLGQLNVKFVSTPSKHELVVTDLCNKINSLQPR